MNYINQKLSAKLQKLGLKSESGMWWATDHNTQLKRFDELQERIGDGWTWFEEAQAKGDVIPAYNLQDIFNPDNLKRAFGEETNEVYQCPKCGWDKEYSKHDENLFCPRDGRKLKEGTSIPFEQKWKHEGFELLEAFWQGWDELEKYLENNL